MISNIPYEKDGLAISLALSDVDATLFEAFEKHNELIDSVRIMSRSLDVR